MPDAYSQKPNRPLKKCLKILKRQKVNNKKYYNMKVHKKEVFIFEASRNYEMTCALY